MILFLILFTFMLLMPPMYAMSILCVSVVFLGIWTGFIMKEEARDEREALHRMYSGRVAYLAGLFVLTLGLIVQELDKHVDPWLVGAIWVMIVTKLVARLYFEKYK